MSPIVAVLSRVPRISEIHSGAATDKLLQPQRFCLGSPTVIFHMSTPRRLSFSRSSAFLSGELRKLSRKRPLRRLRAPAAAIFTFSPKFIFFFQFCFILLPFHTFGYLRPKTIKIMIVEIKLLLN